MISASAPAEVDRIGTPLPSNTCSRLAVRLTAAYAEARKPRKVRPIWVTARKRPGCAIRPLTRFADRLPSSASCSIAGPADRHQGDLGRHEDAFEDGQDDDDDELEDRVHLAGRVLARPWLRRRRQPVSRGARGSGPGRRRRACRAGRRG